MVEGITLNILKSEKFLLNVIKYGPIVFVFIISIFFTQSFIQQQNKKLHHELNALESEYLENNKYRIKEEVNRVYKFVTFQKKQSAVVLKSELKARVYEAHAIATNLYNTYKTTKSQKEITNLIKEALREIRFNDGRGYFYILTTSNATNILNAFHPSLEGKNLYDLKDSKGKFLNRAIIKVIKQDGEGYVDYYWYKPNTDDKMYQKFTFSKEFKPYGFYIGTGEYLTDYEESLKKRVLRQIQSVRYANNRYIFVYDMDGNCYAHFKNEYIGKNRINIKDKNGRYVLQDLLKYTKENKSGFFSYLATITTDKSFQRNDKISFVKYFDDWDWMIGSGFYLDGLNNQIVLKKELLEQMNQESIKSIIYHSIIFTLIFIGISFYISTVLKRKFNDYNLKINKEMNKTIEKERLLIQQNKMATMGEMLSNIAHQWKQPLTTISAAILPLKMSIDLDEKLNQNEVKDTVGTIEKSIENLSQTMSDFRNFFNPNKERKLFKISDAFDDTFELTASQFRNNNISIIKNIKKTELYASQNELQQTLINLLKNAKEELVKKDAKEKRYIFIEAYEKNEKLIITIKDNANGIPTNFMEEIFNSYFTTKEKSGGTGIGLYMCKQIIEESMKGQISASNETYHFEGIEYKGAKFVIEIPLDLRKDKAR